MPEGDDFHNIVQNAVVEDMVPGPEASNLALISVDHDTDIRMFGDAAARFEQAADIGNRLRRTPSVSCIERNRLDVGGRLAR